MKFSVLMCVYYGETPKFFREALESVFNQTLMATEVVLVVDGPVSKDIDNIIFDFEKKYNNMNIIRLSKNMGHGKARDVGLSNCKYGLVAIADSDDINAPNRFEKQIKEFERDPSLSAVSSNCVHFCDSIDNVINEEHLPTSDAEIKKYLKNRCPICQPSVMLSKEAVNKAGGYLDWYYAEDYYLWIRMYLNGCKFANIPENLLYLRTTREQTKRRGGFKYFKSMSKLYFFMYKNNIIGIWRLLINVSSRFILQVLMPNKLRAFIRKKAL